MTRHTRFGCIATIVAISMSQIASAQIKHPALVPGKEYITGPNTDSLGVPTTGMTVGWTALGPSFDSFVYGSTELDAIAHMGDAYFEGLLTDETALIVSLRGSLFPGGPAVDPTFGGLPLSLFYQESSLYGGGTGVWATAPMLNPTIAPVNVSGIELWGSVGDTTHWSEVGDPGGISISTAGGAYLLASEIAFAIGATEAIDLDALMILDHALTTELFHVGDYALMSVAANDQFDGGEIWLLERAAGGTLSASFFEHGGVTWDTANDVSGLFGLPPGFEDIDGLEAMIPAPGTGLVWLVALSATCARRRRDRLNRYQSR